MVFKSIVIEITDGISTIHSAFAITQIHPVPSISTDVLSGIFLLDPWAGYRQTILFLPNQR
jgi:hypothetical protein